MIAGLFLSGVTAFPLAHETAWLVRLSRRLTLGNAFPDLERWLEQVGTALADAAGRYPFLAYGTDWLAFAHLALAVLFLGPYRDPVRNRWVIEFGMLACAGVLPLAWIAGPVRGIPPFWRVIDSSFGVVGFLPLWIAWRATKEIERRNNVAGPGFDRA